MDTAVVLGTFDGLHKGHRAVIESAAGYNTVAVTFDIPPKSYFGGKPELLMLPCDKSAGLKALGVKRIYTLKFPEVSEIPPEDFFFWLKKEFSPKLVACGFNYRFGKGATGDAALLGSLCRQSGIEFKCAGSVGGDQPVSSSKIRELICAGDVLSANGQIFGGFGFTAPVKKGDRRGRTLGFPTANQVFPEMLVLPKFGVYKTKVIIDKEYDSITNIGVRPTYKTEFIGCETYIKGFSGELYGKNITLKFIDFVREEKKFSSKSELQNAVISDIKSVLNIEL